MSKINDNGIIRDMTPKEEMQWQQEIANMHTPEPSAEDEWKLQIEAALIELAAMLGGA